ncbi:multidrug ABC transporter substrate-binding protein [Acidovorax sp. Leaf76]|uniref:ABC transporter permease n=1 Tax=unclassified Acidovorax TaxID=2684926 RepID=UPI0006F7DE7F|nr:MULTISPECIES: ABC transporter permease [unclassified Acidovorax]KQO25575.1 multidrug ABC transporter substrate-binding protein [Acidovorax sp. Leaf76]KQO29258.1 multidrug ABC transporter substrate-binding protein [Acidovorax sp. Leaf84]KQS25782.1 multidrug ABC transporter substrate-binding protein [Acidovorax sp. Leaf191]
MKNIVKLASLSWRYLWSRPLAAVLNLLVLTLGLAAITLVLLVATQLDKAFERDLDGIDLVVGAKGSPLQLILAGVFHIDVPTGNIPLQEVQALQKNPLVAQVIPLSLGDSYQGYRIVGTTPDYVSHYSATLAEGALWQQPMDAVLGASVARGIVKPDHGGAPLVGATFIGSHGLGGGGHAHGDHPYRVSGVLAPCGCVLDRLVLTRTESVWMVHETATATEPEDLEILKEEREVTVALLRYRTPLAAVTLPRQINADTALQAAAPAIEVTRLLRLLGVGADVLRAFGGVLLAVAALSVFIALWNAVRERRADLAMLRMLGAPPGRVAGLVLWEALWLAAMASALGLLMGHTLAHTLGWVLQSQGLLPVSGLVWLPAEAGVPLLAGAVAALAALLPAMQAYRTEVADLLSQP